MEDIRHFNAEAAELIAAVMADPDSGAKAFRAWTERGTGSASQPEYERLPWKPMELLLGKRGKAA